MAEAWWIAAAALAALAAVAILGDRRRHRRTDIDKVGWVPWPLVLILALLGAATCAAIALKA